jgi:hypothetical protein
MACEVPSLLEEACGNGFLQLAKNEVEWRATVLQLFYMASGGNETYDELWEQVCTNGYDSVAQNEKLWRATLLQLFCDSGG